MRSTHRMDWHASTHMIVRIYYCFIYFSNQQGSSTCSCSHLSCCPELAHYKKWKAKPSVYPFKQFTWVVFSLWVVFFQPFSAIFTLVQIIKDGQQCHQLPIFRIVEPTFDRNTLVCTHSSEYAEGAHCESCPFTAPSRCCNLAPIGFSRPFPPSFIGNLPL